MPVPPEHRIQEPEEIGLQELWSAVQKRGSLWAPAVSIFGVFYLALFSFVFILGGAAGWSYGTIATATNAIVLLGLPMGAHILWKHRAQVHDKLAVPPPGPDFSAAQGLEFHGQWDDAVAEYWRVHQLNPLDAESLFRIAGIYRAQLADEAQYVATLRDIEALPPDAEPAWVLAEVGDRLRQLEALDRESAPAYIPPTEIELPPDDEEA